MPAYEGWDLWVGGWDNPRRRPRRPQRPQRPRRSARPTTPVEPVSEKKLTYADAIDTTSREV